MKLSMKQKDIEKLVVDLKSNYNIYAEQNNVLRKVVLLAISFTIRYRDLKLPVLRKYQNATKNTILKE